MDTTPDPATVWLIALLDRVAADDEPGAFFNSAL
jgi:hypothetical protein